MRGIISLLWKPCHAVLSEYLNSHPCIVFVLSAHNSPELTELVELSGSRVVELDQLNDENINGDVKEETGIHMYSLQSLLKSAEWTEHSTRMGIEKPELFAKLIECDAESWIAQSIFLINKLSIVERLAEIEVVLLNEDVLRYSRLVLQWAQVKGIPVIHVDHGMSGVNPYGVHAEIKADYLLVSGVRSLEYWEESGAELRKISVSGYPGSDNIVSNLASLKLKREYLIDKHFHGNDGPIVVFGTTWFSKQSALNCPEIYENTVRAYLVAIRQLRSRGMHFNFILKDRAANSNVNTDLLLHLMREEGVSRLPYTFEDGHELIANAAIVVSYFSGLTAECMICGTPAINLIDLNGLRFGPSYGAGDGVVEVDEHGLATAIEKLIFDIEYRNKKIAALNIAANKYNLLGCNAAVNVAKFARDVALPVEGTDFDEKSWSKSTPYEEWLKQRQFDPVSAQKFDNFINSWHIKPRFLIVVLCDEKNVAKLAGTLASISVQDYEAQVVIISTMLRPEGFVDSAALKWVCFEWYRSADKINAVVSGLKADWFSVMYAGDLLESTALLLVAQGVQRNPDWNLVYFDDDVVENNRFDCAFFKPDFDLDLYRSCSYIGESAFINFDVFVRLGGFCSASCEVAFFDYILRCAEFLPFKSIGHLPYVLLHRELKSRFVDLTSSVNVIAEKKKILSQHLSRLGLAATVLNGHQPDCLDVNYLSNALPLLSILIPVSKDQTQINECLNSLLENTRYQNYEVLLLDNANNSAELQAWFTEIDNLQSSSVRVFRVNDELALPEAFNALAIHANGEALILIEPSMRVIQNDWLERFAGIFERAEVSAIVPRVLNNDAQVIGLPLIVGLHEQVSTGYGVVPIDYKGYAAHTQYTQQVAAFEFACIAVRRNVFVDLGGFDCKRYPKKFADVDFALRLNRFGGLIVWNPHINVLCTEDSIYRAALDEERFAGTRFGQSQVQLLDDWLPELAKNEYRNPNFALTGSAKNFDPFSLEVRSILLPSMTPWKPLPIVAAFPGDEAGCGQYRIIQPARALNAAGCIQAHLLKQHLGPVELVRAHADALIVQRQISDAQLVDIRAYRRFSSAKIIYELDDLIDQVPLASAHKNEMPKDVLRRLRQGLELSDVFIASTEPIKAAYGQWAPQALVVPNRLPRTLWGDLKPLRRQSIKPRVGWGGGVGHAGDLQLITSVIKALAQEVEWVFFGMCPDEIRPYVKEFHPGVSFANYPAKLGSLNLDLALAPLEINAFNEAKSNLRLLEYGILGYPVICTDIYPYQNDLPVSRVKNRHQEWVKAIREHLSDMDHLALQGDKLRSAILANWMLEDHLEDWAAAWLGRVPR